MKRLILVLALLWPVSLLADFQAGMDAYKRGEYAKAYREWLPLAEQGDAKAQYRLGLLSAGDRRGVAKDEAAMLMWVRRAADQDFSDAQWTLGNLYFYGPGGHVKIVKKDFAEALRWYRKASEWGQAFAQERLGDMYLRGWGVEFDPPQAFVWFSLSAANGNKFAKKKRDELWRWVNDKQIAEARRLTQEWKPDTKREAK